MTSLPPAGWLDTTEYVASHGREPAGYAPPDSGGWALLDTTSGETHQVWGNLDKLRQTLPSGRWVVLP